MKKNKIYFFSIQTNALSIKNYFKKLIQPQNPDKNLNRQELLLNILLSSSIVGFALINLIQLINRATSTKGHGLPPIYTGLIFLFLIFLFWLSKKGQIKITTWLLITTYSLPMFHLFILQGTDLPTSLLLAVLIISLFGLLIEDGPVLMSSAIIGIFMILLAYFQHTSLIKFNDYWRAEKNEVTDTVIYALLLLVIALIIWLLSRSLKQALASARESEEKLQEEYELLEIKVIERTKQLHQAEEEKIIQLYRLAEFGRLSSGIFHDLINPLTAVSLNLEQIKGEAGDKIVNAKSYLDQALLATHRMENLIVGIKKQIQQKSSPTVFIVNEEIEQIIQILTHKARQAKIQINFISTEIIKFYGDAVKFGQIIINLLANAIEASEEQIKISNDHSSKKEIKIELLNQKNKILILVSDQGVGIMAENIDKIFEPFFSTKTENDRGLGLGLASVKNITEHNFSGSITVESQINLGSRFIVSLPLDPIKNLINKNNSI
ncbi:MAG: HAMP domain-containing sensor histidine kinase [Patescibacteria group bacterium]|jgi:signal transduction histidine kinase